MQISSVNHYSEKEKHLTTQFLHTVIDLGLRRIIAPDGKDVLVCQIDANTPILLWGQDLDEGDGTDYSIGRALDTKDKLCFDIKPFEFIVKRYAETICFCVIAQNDTEESIYHVQCIEQGKVVRERTPDGAIGKVSLGQRCEFDLEICSLTQTFRVETIPSEDCIYGKSKIIYRVEEEQEEGEN